MKMHILKQVEIKIIVKKKKKVIYLIKIFHFKVKYQKKILNFQQDQVMN